MPDCQPTVERYSCARASCTADEPLHGTASTVRRWVLLEQPGAWGVDAVFDSDLDPTVAAAAQVATAQVGARLVLIRRTGGGHVGAGCRGYAAFSGARGSWVEQFGLRTPGDLLDLDLSRLRDGRSVGGRRLHRPLYLVCTNGKHDPCCAEFGLPLARALAGDLDERLWECSHIGGDRFAANLVCLPEGVYYGRVTPDVAAAVVAAHDAGRIDLAHYRGRSIHPFVVQAADDLARRHLDLTALDALTTARWRAIGDGRTEVTFDGAAGGTITVVVSTSPPEPQRLTCTAPASHRPPRYTLDAIHVAAP